MVNLQDLCEEARVTLIPLAESNGNRLTVHCPPEVQPVYTDPARLKQVLLNLLSNACKFTHGGEVSLTVEVCGKNLVFAVVDTGEGSEASKLGEYFEAFSQGDSSTRRRYGGAGLGLTISKRICDILGAQLEAESVLGEGSTFTVVLPHSVQPAS